MALINVSNFCVVDSIQLFQTNLEELVFPNETTFPAI